MSSAGYMTFMKINWTLPSFAAIERLFSAAARVLTARRCRMSDETLNIFLWSLFNVWSIMSAANKYEPTWLKQANRILRV